MSRSTNDVVTDFINGTLNKGTLPDGVSPYSAASNAMSYDNQDVLSDWLFPAKKEYRQMAEQLQMDSLEPLVKMEGLRAAGINPLTAASAVAGASPSSPQPASSVNPIGDVAGAVGAVAGAGDSVASAVSTLSKLGSEIRNIDADTSSKLADIGLTNAQTQGVITDNTYKDEDWRTRLNVQRQQFENMKQELTNLKATHREIMTHCDEMISQIELTGSAKDFNDAMFLKVQEETRWMKELNDWRISHNLHIVDSGIDGYIFDMVMRGADISEFDKFIDVYSEYRGRVAYNEQKGQSMAERRYGTSKSPWEMGDKYMSRFVDWIHQNGKDDPVVMYEQIRDVYDGLMREHPEWGSDRVVKQLYDFGFSKDEVYKALKNE